MQTYSCPSCSETVRVIPAAKEVTHLCPNVRLRGRPQSVKFTAVAA